MIELILCKTIMTLVMGKILSNPKIPIQDSYYPSGNKEADKYYSWDKPSKKYPLLKIDNVFYDMEYNKLEPGIYSAEFRQDINSVIIKSGQQQVKAPVFQIIKLKQKINIPSAKIAFVKNKKVIIVYKKENLEVHCYLYLPEAITGENP